MKQNVKKVLIATFVCAYVWEFSPCTCIAWHQFFQRWIGKFHRSNKEGHSQYTL